jgi:hypothetical protein
MSIKVMITENEILNTPNDIELGNIVRKKYFELIEKSRKENNEKIMNNSEIRVEKTIKKAKDLNSWKRF